MRVNTVLAISMFLSAPSPTGAQDFSDYPVYSAERAGSPQFRVCMARKDSNLDESFCLTDELQRQRTELKIAFDAKLRSASPAQRAQMIKAQGAWEAFVASNCAVRALSGGSGAGIFKVGCLVRETITRRTELTDNWDY